MSSNESMTVDVGVDEIQDLKTKIKLQGEKVRALKSLKTDQDTGTRNYNEKEMTIREKIFSIFKEHRAVTIDTPVSELKEILSGKYSDDSKFLVIKTVKNVLYDTI
ncbi:16102_t:CDS:2 [Cetraspora pellucida]|uniref:16102_t:CDS:1 n=1 Tax=Cetraspora pellucida TaxID=1433469 RepID=A0A9N9AD62_9GLOM|nr:16102_t:CDS:2 [Cetraspora pellucida]